MQLGPGSLLVTADLRFAARLTADGVTEAVRRLEQQLRSLHPEVRQVFVEATGLHAARPST